MGAILGLIRGYALEWVLLGVIALIYLINADWSRTLQPGEVYTLQAAKEMVLSGNWIVPTFNQQPIHTIPPLVLWLIGLAFQFFGVKLLVARVVMVVLGMLTLALTYWLGTLLYKSRFAAILSAVLLATTWGFFRAVHWATPFNAVLPLFLMACGIFYLWHPLATRPKTFGADIRFYSLAEGVLFGLLFLAGGTPALLLLGSVLLMFLFVTHTLEVLGTVDWKKFLAAFLIIALPWPIIASFVKGDPTFLMQVFFGLPLEQLSANWEHGLLLQRIVFYVLIMLLIFAPWTPLLVYFWSEVLQTRGSQQRIDVLRQHEFLFPLLWLVIAGLFSLAGMDRPTLTMLPVMSPLMLLLGQLLDGMIQEARPSGPFRLSVEALVLLMFAGALGSAWFLFLSLPDEYTGSIWYLPGQTMVHTLVLPKDLGEIQLGFPLWKLWLLPGPLLLLVGGVWTLILMTMERARHVTLTLALLSALGLAYISAVMIPVLGRPIEAYYGGQFHRLSDPKDVFVLYQPDERLLRTLFFMPYRPGNPVRFIQQPEQLEGLIASLPEGTRVRGIMRESRYYELPESLRLRLFLTGDRHGKSEWVWNFPLLDKVWDPNVKPEPDTLHRRTHLLVFQSLPSELQGRDDEELSGPDFMPFTPIMPGQKGGGG